MGDLKIYICDKCGSKYEKPEIMINEELMEEIKAEHPEAKVNYLCDHCVAIISAPRN